MVKQEQHMKKKKKKDCIIVSFLYKNKINAPDMLTKP